MEFMASWSPMKRWHSEDHLPIIYTPPFDNDAPNHPCLGTEVPSVSTTDLSSNRMNPQLMWNQSQLNSDTMGSFRQEDYVTNNPGGKFLELFSSGSLTNEIVDDYSKKISSSSNSGVVNSISGYNNNLDDHDRISVQSNFVPTMSHYSLPDISRGELDQYRYDCNQSGLFGNSNVDSLLELNTNKLCEEMMNVPWSCTQNLAELISFNSGLNSSQVERSVPKTKTSSSRSSEISCDSKKRKAGENSGTSSKKSKQQNVTTIAKVQVPKVKLGEKISALQQLVAPFGKTDTASVLLDAIKYIEFLHEQVRLLSDPYIKSSASKDQNAIWGKSLDKKEKLDEDTDLRSRGLCLIPVSSAPPVCRDNSDYWAPPYRGCLFR